MAIKTNQNKRCSCKHCRLRTFSEWPASPCKLEIFSDSWIKASSDEQFLLNVNVLESKEKTLSECIDIDSDVTFF